MASNARCPSLEQDLAQPALVGALRRDVRDLDRLARHGQAARSAPSPFGVRVARKLREQLVRRHCASRAARTPRPPRRTRRSRPPSSPESWTARATMVVRTVSRSSVELTARPTSPSAVSCSTERVSSAVRASSSLNSRTFSIAMTAWSAKVCRSPSRYRRTARAGAGSPGWRRSASPSRSIGTVTTLRSPTR